MRWGVELWDGFDDVSSYLHRGIEFFEKYEEFWKKRCAIENTYAKSLRKLVEAYEPKKKDAEENKMTHVKCFARMLGELRDIAGQHELIAENVQEKVLQKLVHMIKSLKEERRKSIDDKDKITADYEATEEALEKSRQRYERAFKEVEKANDLLLKVENDDSASKNDIKKQKNVCELKQRACNQTQADYGNQLCEANRVQALYYNDKLPAVLDAMQTLEKRRVDTFKDLVLETVNIEIEVLPRIQQCLKEIEQSALQVSALEDTELVVAMFKTGYAVPGDHVFEDLNDKSQFNSSRVSITNNGSINSTNGGGGGGVGATLSHLLSPSSHSSSSHLNGLVNTNGGAASRQKKYRTINRLKGLLFTTGSSSSGSAGGGSLVGNGGSGKHEPNDVSLFDLPPQQMKKELVKKIDAIQTEMCRKQKEREGLVKLKEIYSTNQKFGDSQSALEALKANEDRLASLGAQLKKYQDLLNELEANAAYYSTGQSHYQASSHYAPGCNVGNGNEYALSTTSNGSSTSSNGSGTTLPRDCLKSQNIYQSPSEHSVNSNGTSLPGTPMSYHSNGHSMTMTMTSTMTTNATVKSSTIGAYAVSAVAGKLNGKMAPMACSDRNESFDEDDEPDEEDDEEEEDYEDTYEKPTMIKNVGGGAGGGEGKQLNVVSHNNGVAGGGDSPQYDHVDASLVQEDADESGAAAAAASEATGFENDQVIGTALVMYAFAGTVQNAMSIQENESLNVLERDSGDGWTLVKRLNGEKGYVPTDYIQIVYY